MRRDDELPDWALRPGCDRHDPARARPETALGPSRAILPDGTFGRRSSTSGRHQGRARRRPSDERLRDVWVEGEVGRCRIECRARLFHAQGRTQPAPMRLVPR
jgi:hypothetical protein